jgi:hypothetical protein
MELPTIFEATESQLKEYEVQLKQHVEENTESKKLKVSTTFNFKGFFEFS